MNNRIGIYFAFWEQEWEADYCRYIEKVKTLGFDTLELAAGCLPDLGKEKRREIAERAREAGIDLTFCIGLPPAYDPASPDSQVRKEAVRFVQELLRCIREMDGDMIGGILYSCWPGPVISVEEKEKARQRSLESMREIGKAAGEYGVDCCLEIVNRFEQYLLNTAHEGVEFVRELDNPRIKLLLDSFHMNIEEDSFYDAIMEARDVLGHFHIGECNRKTPGLGRMDWDTIIRGLKDADYQGRIVMEPFIRPGGQVGKDIKIYRDQSQNAGEQEMDRLAREAQRFIRNKLKEAEGGK